MQEKIIEHVIVGDIATNCWIYPLAENDTSGQTLPPEFRGCALVDPGDEAGKIVQRLDQLKLIPRYIVLTHGHFDHITALPAIARRYGGEPPVIAIHQADAGYLGAGMPPPTRTLMEGDAIGPFTVLHIPGHTPGSIGLWDRAAGVLFSGDTLFCGDYGRTDLPGGSEEQIFASLRRLFAMDPAIRVFPGHGPTTTIGRESTSLGL